MSIQGIYIYLYIIITFFIVIYYVKDMMYFSNLTASTEAFAAAIPYAPIGQWRLDVLMYTKNPKNMTKIHIITFMWFFELKLGTNYN